MIAVVIGVLAVLVVAAIIWARIGAARSESRSVETYEHALGVLGEVSKRTESTGFRILPHEQAGRPHVGKRIDALSGEVSDERPAREDAVPTEQGQGPVMPKRLPPAGEPKLRLSGPIRSRAHAGPDEPGQAPVEQTRAPSAGGPPTGTRTPLRPSPRPFPGVAYQSSADRRRQVMARRAATGATAAVALAAVVVAGVYLAGSGGGAGPKKGTTTTTTTTRSKKGGGAKTTTTTTTTSTTLPNTLRPTSLSPVTFKVPSDGYTLAFQVTGGPCWVGIEHSSAGPWLFAETLSPGQSASYKASGALMVTLGAPSHLALTVDGLTAELPSTTQAYSFDLVPATA